MRQIFFFLEFSWFFYDPMYIGNLISVLSAFYKSNLNIWEFLIHIVLKPSLKDFENYLASMWNEWDCVVLSGFFGIALLWYWEWKLTFSSPTAAVEFSEFASMFSAAS